MSKGLDIELFGMDALKERIANLSNGMIAEVDKSMAASVSDINKIQKSYTPVDNGVLRQGNRFSVNSAMNYTIYNDVKYAPYVEFGTGGYVFFGENWVGPELASVAAQFKGKGVRKVNLYPQPFFFRAFFEKKREMIENIRKILTK